MEQRTIGEKIIVIGCSGSGKSTLAARLHEKTGLPLTHLDNVWWKADRTHITRDEFDRKLAAILAEDRWIVDGDFSRTYEVRIRASDTVIFLDYDEEVCLAGITARVGTMRADIPWQEASLDPWLVEQVKRFREENRPQLMALFEKYPDKKLLVFKSREETERFLCDL